MRSTTRRHVLATLIALMGLANLSSSLMVHAAERNQLLHALLPLELAYGARHAALLAGFSLVALAYGLWRGKRLAWRLALGMLGASAVFHLLKGLDWEEALTALVLAAGLVWQRQAFQARSDSPTLQRALRALPLAVGALLLYATAGFYIFRSVLAPFNLALAVQEFGARLVWNDGPYAALAHGRALWFLHSLTVLGLALAALSVWALLRPVLAQPARDAERDWARALVARYGSSSLSPFALTDDKSLYFAQNGEGVVAYKVAHGVAVVCGDPVAPSDQVGALAQEFAAFCHEQDWGLAFYEVQATLLEQYAPLGFEPVKIGEDAWIDLTTFSLQGKAIADIRHAVSKIGRDGLVLHWLDGQGDLAYWLQVQAQEADWRKAQGGIELGFSIGPMPQQPQPDAHYLLALAPDRTRVLAYCAFLPISGIDGVALDVMRRGPLAPNGTMEWLIAQALLGFKERGLAWCSLGMAPLSNVAPLTEQQRLVDRGVCYLYQHPKINELYHYQSLFFFKKKFNPQWRSGYLLYPSTLHLPQVLLAVIQVHASQLGWRFILRTLGEQGTSRIQWLLARLRPGLQAADDATVVVKRSA